ncbi:MAG: type II toxin-antitoxin system HicB family antitoxin [Terriglobia bacterium]
MNSYTYLIKVEREGCNWYAYSEDFPGAYGLGKTIEEAKGSLLEAMKIYIRDCRARKRPVPHARTIYAETVSLVL